MIEYRNAIDVIRSTVSAFEPEQVALENAGGTVVAADLPSPAAVPPFDNSAMDGFAVVAADTKDASAENPVTLSVTGMVTAGEAASTEVTPSGNSWEIMTGAPVPAGCNGVIPVERVEVKRDPQGKPIEVTISTPVAEGQNLRHAGDDFAAGDALVYAGQLIKANQIMGLAATGVSELSARRAPRVAAITTGNELTDAGETPELAPGMIHDSNGPYLEAAITSIGADSAGVYRTGDSAEELISLIEGLQGKADVILTTGGVSAGRMDFVPNGTGTAGCRHSLPSCRHSSG